VKQHYLKEQPMITFILIPRYNLINSIISNNELIEIINMNDF